MGFKNSESNITYIRVAEGKLIVKAKEGDPGAIPRIVTKGKNAGDTVWEFHYDAFEGYIKDVSIKENNEYGDQFNILVADPDNGHRSIITIPLSGRHSSRFFLVMDGINLEKPVTFSPYKFEARDADTKKVIKDKFIQGWNLYQSEEKLEPTVDVKELPDLEQVKIQGKLQWDDSKRLDEFRSMFDKWKEESFDRSKDKDDGPPAPSKQRPAYDSPAKKGVQALDDDEEEETPF